MKIACIDDAPAEGETLLSLVKEQFEKYKISVAQTDYFSSGDCFFRSWNPGMYRIIFLDIFLVQESGIEIAKTIRRLDPGVVIIFCSTSNDFAAESYDVQANYYLVKPVSEKNISCIIHRLNLLRKDEDILELPDHRMLPVRQLIYSEYHNHLITMYMKNGTTDKLWCSQADFIGMLEPFDYFLSVNPGTIINMKEIVSFDDDLFRMSNGSTIPISKRRKKEITNIYKSYLFSELRNLP